jgi:hypothetical protein
MIFISFSFNFRVGGLFPGIRKLRGNCKVGQGKLGDNVPADDATYPMESISIPHGEFTGGGPFVSFESSGMQFASLFASKKKVLRFLFLVTIKTLDYDLFVKGQSAGRYIQPG